MKNIIKIFFLFITVFVYAKDVEITVDEGVSVSQPIAILPFNANSADLPDIAQIIADDLQNSGLFAPLNRSKFPEKPKTAKEVHTNLWTNLGSDLIVIGQIVKQNKDFKISFQLLDTLNRSAKVTLTASFNSTKDEFRATAHKISNLIFTQITKIKGVFNTKIAYILQDAPNSYKLQIADYDGHNAQTITQSTEPLMSPAFSPDGKNLVYTRFTKRNSVLLNYNFATKQTTILANSAGHNGSAVFSSDGKFLVFASSRDGALNLYLLNLKTSELTQLTKLGNNTEPSFSPDNQSIVFTSDRNGAPAIFMMNKDGSNQKRISSSNFFSAKITKDGKNIIMISQDRLVKFKTQTAKLEILTSTFLDETPTIAPNDTMIIYSSTKGEQKVLQLISSNGRFKTTITSTKGNFKFTAWSPFLN